MFICAHFTVAESLHYEHTYVVTEDYPTEDKKLKCGDRIIAVSILITWVSVCVCVCDLKFYLFLIRLGTKTSVP